jgi:tRNA-dihydrouridine synthase B
LLPNPKAVGAFLDQALPAMSGRLSIKMRLGRNHAREIETLLPLMDGYPIDSITIHPRTGIQMYAGRPDLEAFEKCLSLTKHQVIYNGDIVSKAGLERLQERFPDVKTWMIGRGVISDPFLPAIIKGQTIDGEVRIRQFYAFHEALFARYQSSLFGPRHLLDKMKGLWTYFSGGFNDGQNLCKRIHKTQKLAQYCETVSQFFHEQPVMEEVLSPPSAKN